MPTNDEIRLDEIERRMNKYDEILDRLNDIVVGLKARADTSNQWITALIYIACAVIGGLVGHLVH